MSSRFLASASAVAVAVTMSTLRPALADDLPGKVILARASGSAIVIYDATPEVAAIVRDKVADAAADERLERDAIHALSIEAASVADSSDVTVRVTYSKSGDVSPVYGTPTFEGIERYAILTCSGTDLKANRSKLMAFVTNGTPPAWLKFAIIGKLPPR